MKNVILKTAVITLASAAAAALIVFSMWILISPQTMAEVSVRIGNYSFAVTCSDLRYKYTGDVSDLAKCAEYSILAESDENIIKYGEMLIEDPDYDSLCEQKDKGLSDGDYGYFAYNYNAYICGYLSVAQYRSGGLDKAINTAQNADSFTKLVIEVLENGTKSDAQKVKDAYVSSADYDQNLYNLLDEFIN